MLGCSISDQIQTILRFIDSLFFPEPLLTDIVCFNVELTGNYVIGYLEAKILSFYFFLEYETKFVSSEIPKIRLEMILQIGNLRFKTMQRILLGTFIPN